MVAFSACSSCSKSLPGRLEPVATMVIPGVIVALLFLLPFIDRRDERRPSRRRFVTTAFCGGLLIVAALTSLGLRDTPPIANVNQWAPLSLAGYQFAHDERCQVCHRIGGAASPIDETIARRDSEWLVAHVRDPRDDCARPASVPGGAMTEGQGRSVVAYMRRCACRRGRADAGRQPGRHCRVRPLLLDVPHHRRRGRHAQRLTSVTSAPVTMRNRFATGSRIRHPCSSTPPCRRSATG